MPHALRRRTLVRPLLWTAFTSLAIAAPGAPAADEEALLNARCGSCHQRIAGGGLARVSEVRKSPEGWDMNLVRMMLVHGVKLAPDERRRLVKHLADEHGLAPSESSDWRYILERRPDVVESPPDAEIASNCARCHSYARVALQRRDEGEWRKLAHFHVGQYPTLEYQAGGRDRNWWQIASNDLPAKLAKLYPLDTDAWRAWQGAPRAALSGTWRIAGHRPGHGQYQGTLSVSAKDEADAYAVEMNVVYASGASAKGAGTAVVYTGYEWRARVTLGTEKVLQVGALSADGRALSGRWFLADQDALGAEFRAVRAGGAGGPEVLQVSPAFLRAGESTNVSVHGAGLGGAVSLGDGVEVVQVVSRSPTTIIVEARASADAAVGARTVRAGAASAEGLFTVYRTVDSVRVEPDYAIARVGGGGGPVAPVPAQFDAVGYANGEDGVPGTADDVRIGAMRAAWSTDDFDEGAAAAGDARYAGRIDASGLFAPGPAGLNPERRYRTNNVGNLAVKARVTDAGSAVEGKGRLIVTVQRWVDPPIR